MFPAFLITLREVIEASLIVSTILGILVQLRQLEARKTVWKAVGVALIASISLLCFGSFLGFQVSELYEKNEAYIEGALMIVSAFFITWAVFFLHTYFSSSKSHLIHNIKKSIENTEQKGVFLLVFTAVFREGFEIMLFLSTIYLSTHPQEVTLGFFFGIIGGLLISLLFFKATSRIPITYAFKVTSLLLILFAAGLLARGVHEFSEVGLLPVLTKITFPFIPQKGIFIADIIKSLFGITQTMDILQLLIYGIYSVGMFWYVFKKKQSSFGSRLSRDT